MQRLSLKLLFALLPVLAGCAAISGWMAGSIDEGIPKLRDKLPRTAKIHLPDPVKPNGHALHARNLKLVSNAFGKALDGIGVSAVIVGKALYEGRIKLDDISNGS